MSKKEKEIEEVKPPEKLSLVMYTDGGCKPSRGHGGYGFHGYLYTDEKPKQGAGAKAVPTKEGYVVGAKDNAVTVHNYIDCACPFEEITTNNITEMEGVKQAMETAMQQDVEKLLVLTDSNYVLKGLTEWVPGWIKRDWRKPDGEEVQNKNEWLSLLSVRDRLEASGIKLKIDKVRGHSGDLGNTMADMLASAAVIMARKGLSDKIFKVSEAKGYWNNKVDYNRLLSKA
ncbi:MAG: hypothetical protein CL582_04425, partial [Alteromonadaceae bacterium]|nr:hypothetical protein [Alteromonadaceae bacterium]